MVGLGLEVIEDVLEVFIDVEVAHGHLLAVKEVREGAGVPPGSPIVVFSSLKPSKPCRHFRVCLFSSSSRVASAKQPVLNWSQLMRDSLGQAELGLK